jgi:hypothetical protein
MTITALRRTLLLLMASGGAAVAATAHAAPANGATANGATANGATANGATANGPTASVAVAIGDPALPFKAWLAIRQVVGNQLKALKSGNGRHALGYATPAIRAQFGTPDNFLRMVRNGYAPLLEARSTQFLQGAVIDGTAFQAMRLVLPDNAVLVALYQMEKQSDGRWRIAGCVLAPSTVVAT